MEKRNEENSKACERRRLAEMIGDEAPAAACGWPDEEDEGGDQTERERKREAAEWAVFSTVKP